MGCCMNKYSIKQKIVAKPEIELPEGSQAISVKHHDKYFVGDVEYLECWRVIWLEPVKEKR